MDYKEDTKPMLSGKRKKAMISKLAEIIMAKKQGLPIEPDAGMADDIEKGQDEARLLKKRKEDEEK